MNQRKDKAKCTECSWKGHTKDLDQIKDPKSDSVWSVCPQCRTPENIASVCDENKCWDVVTCGTPTKEGYRSTCGKHSPEEAK